MHESPSLILPLSQLLRQEEFQSPHKPNIDKWHTLIADGLADDMRTRTITPENSLWSLIPPEFTVNRDFIKRALKTLRHLGMKSISSLQNKKIEDINDYWRSIHSGRNTLTYQFARSLWLEAQQTPKATPSY